MPYTRDALDQARQHQEMRNKYPAYGKLYDFVQDAIIALDATWHHQEHTEAQFHFMRGQKFQLTLLINSLDHDLDLNIGEELKKIEDHERQGG